MFRYNRDNYTIVDDERGIVVEQVEGPGHSVFAGLMKACNWQFRFLISKASDRYTFDGDTPIENPDYTIELDIRVGDVAGTYDMEEHPFTLAREAAIAMETEFFGNELSKITTNRP